MKTPEEIERLSAKELETLAAAQGLQAPRDLRQRLCEALAAGEVAAQAERKQRSARWPGYALAAAAAAAALWVALPQRGPRDTFDDPQLAYAEVEKVFRTISDKISPGVDLARQAQEIAGKPHEIIDKSLSR